MLLRDLLKAVDPFFTKDIPDIIFESVCDNSQNVKKRSLFFVRDSKAVSYVQEAIEKGACAIITNQSLPKLPVFVLQLDSLEKIYSRLIYCFYQNPLDNLKVSVGITGTNGKTTTSYLIKNLFEFLGYQVITLGTVAYHIAQKTKTSSLTTPGVLQLAQLLQEGVQQKCTHLVMEVSSHALEQQRVQGILYDRAVFINLTQDHLDYHLNFENYYQAKKKLFISHLKKEGVAIVNVGDEYGQRLSKELVAKVITYTVKTKIKADVCLKKWSWDVEKQKTIFCVEYQNKDCWFESALMGSVHLENLLAVITLGFSLNFTEIQIKQGISQTVVEGRLQAFYLSYQRIAFVDYAHTPDALKKTLKTLRDLKSGKIICIFGCGGNRDVEKRALMGEIAEQYSDQVWITNDNPRFENPQNICQDILKGIKNPQKVFVELDRKKCILLALEKMKKNDLLLIAGKGHEDYQIFGNEKKYFSDIDILKEYCD